MDPEAVDTRSLNIGGDLLTGGIQDLSLLGVVAAGRELEEAGESGLAGDVLVPGICAFFFGVSIGGASQISISSKLSSSLMRKTFGSGLLRWTEVVGMASVIAAVVPIEVRQEGFPSPRSNCVDFCSSSLPPNS